ncbi:MAG: ankyrin repeat domain-containing protein [Spirochaetales bacterium]|nr:ankyrin repeat domain-containing protein [Spirochaetales bacterium]
MIVYIILLNAPAEEAIRLKSVLNENLITGGIIKLPEEIEETFLQNLLYRLHSTRNLIYIADKADNSSPWLPVLSAFASGKNSSLLVFQQQKKCRLPLYMENFTRMKSLDDLEHFFHTQKRFTERSDRINKAQEKLKKQGYSFHTPLFLKAIEEENTEIIILFLDSGMPLEIYNDHGTPALSLAVKTGNIELVKRLIERSSNINIENIFSNRIPLQEAAGEGFADITDLLIRSGADINHQQNDGVNALMLAAGGGHLDCARILAEAGAELDLKDNLGMTALKYAKLMKKDKTAEFLEQKISERDKV